MSQPMRILHVIDKLSNDGSGMHGPARQLAYRLPLYPPDAFQTRVVSLRSEETALAFYQSLGISACALCRSKFDLRACTDIVREIRGFKPDILHLHGYASQVFGRVIGRLMRIPTVIQEHAVLPHIPLYERVADRLLGGTQTAALAVSDGVADFLRTRRHVRGTIQVIWNGVPDALFDNPVPAAQRDALREEFELGEGTRTVGIVGRLAEGKGHMTFLDAAASVHETHPDIRFLIVGEGACRARIEEAIRARGLDSCIRLTGFRTDTNAIMAMLDIHVIASFAEGFPGVAVENLVARTPMICTDLPAFRTFVEDGRDCLMFPPGDAGALTGAIRTTLDGPGEAARRVAAGYEAAQRCRMSRIAQTYIAMYRRLLAEQ